MFSPDDPLFANSLEVVDATIKRETDSGPGWYRYNGDGYGDGITDGHPWAPSNKGNGHLWPALTAERAEQSLQLGDRATAAQLFDTMARYSSGFGLIAEQVWEQPDLAASPFGTDPTLASIGFVNGKPAGSASPLVWSAGSFVRLAANLRAGRLVDQPTNTVDRYIDNTQGQTTLTITAPENNTAVSGSPVTVSGTTEAGNQVDVLVSNIDVEHGGFGRVDSCRPRRFLHRRRPHHRWSPGDHGRGDERCGRYRPGKAHHRLRLRAGCCVARRDRSRWRRQRPRQLPHTRPLSTSTTALGTCSASRCWTMAPTSSSGC